MRKTGATLSQTVYVLASIVGQDSSQILSKVKEIQSE